MADPNLKTDLIDWNGCEWVASVPERTNGTPVVVRTRMDADGVLVNFDDGMIAEEYGVPRHAVDRVLKFSGRSKHRNAA